MALLLAGALALEARAHIPGAVWPGLFNGPAFHLNSLTGPDAVPVTEGDTAGPASPMDKRFRLLKVARQYGESTFIPYVWGGDAVGDMSVCVQCRDCLQRQGRKASPTRRHRNCPACRSCGVDCSHLVNRVFREAGLEFPYLSSRALLKSKPAELKRQYGLIPQGRRLASAQPGDILLHDRHVSILLEVHDDRHADILHASRAITSKGVPGGVEIVRNVDLTRFRGAVRQIFRHQELVVPGAEPRLPGESLPSGRQRLASGGSMRRIPATP